MTDPNHVYDREDSFDLSSSGTIVEVKNDGGSQASLRLSSGTATNYTLEVSNDGSNWWTATSFSSTSDIDDTRTIPERYARLQLASADTVADTAEVELTVAE